MEDLEKAIPTNLELIEKLKGSEELTTLINNSNDANWKSKIGGELKQVYTPFDDSIQKHLGIDKPDDIKSSAYYDGFIKELADTRKELEVLKGKGAEGDEAKEQLWNDRFNKIKGELETAQLENKNISQKGFEDNVNGVIANFLIDKTFKPSYSKDDINILAGTKTSNIVKNTKKLDNGKVAVWNPIKNEYYTDTLGEPLTPLQVAQLEFAPMFQTKTPGGNSPQGDTIAPTKGDVVAIDMKEVKNKKQFFDQFQIKLAPKGLASHSEDYLKIQRATMAHYKINDLPLS